MADGQVVLVTTEPLGGGSPVRSVYFVAEQDPETAKAIIGAMMAPNEKVEAWGGQCPQGPRPPEQIEHPGRRRACRSGLLEAEFVGPGYHGAEQQLVVG